jgi:hypothetical protein
MFPAFPLSRYLLNHAVVLLNVLSLQVMSVAGSMQQLSAQPGQASLLPRGYSPSVSRTQTSAAEDLEHCMVMDEIEQLITEVWGTGVKTEVVMRLLGLGHCR